MAIVTPEYAETIIFNHRNIFALLLLFFICTKQMASCLHNLCF